VNLELFRYYFFVFLVKEYKAELIKAQNKRLTTLVGKVMVEKEWLAKKARQLGLI
jgi:putative transposase